MLKKAAVVEFLGSNCVVETVGALESLGYRTTVISQNETNIKDFHLLVLPGGFSYGDYISAGRIAKFSNIITAIKKTNIPFILGICNGFQILCESGILPGAIIENINQKFICKDIEVSFNNQNFSLPIAHQAGRYYIDDIKKLAGYEIISYKNNPNGSIDSIAGIYDKKRRIMGLMPHPERNIITPFKKTDGKIIFDFISEKINETI